MDCWEIRTAAVSGDNVAAHAAAAARAIVAIGARLLVDEPWRVARVIRGAEDMTLEALSAETARRRRIAPPADFNRALALAQLSRALENPGFAAAWAGWRSRAPP